LREVYKNESISADDKAITQVLNRLVVSANTLQDEASFHGALLGIDYDANSFISVPVGQTFNVPLNRIFYDTDGFWSRDNIDGFSALDRFTRIQVRAFTNFQMAKYRIRVVGRSTRLGERELSIFEGIGHASGQAYNWANCSSAVFRPETLERYSLEFFISSNALSPLTFYTDTGGLSKYDGSSVTYPSNFMYFFLQIQGFL